MEWQLAWRLHIDSAAEWDRCWDRTDLPGCQPATVCRGLLHSHSHTPPSLTDTLTLCAVDSAALYQLTSSSPALTRILSTVAYLRSPHLAVQSASGCDECL